MEDDVKQTVLARDLVAGGGLSVLPVTVLECEWVFRGFYDLDRETVVRLLRALLGLREIDFVDGSQVEKAVSALESGMDFADALQMFLAEGKFDLLYTFDQRFVSAARRVDCDVEVVELTGQ